MPPEDKKSAAPAAAKKNAGKGFGHTAEVPTVRVAPAAKSKHDPRFVHTTETPTIRVAPPEKNPAAETPAS